MSIARAVTKRIKRPEMPKDAVSPLPSRSHTVKSPTQFDRSKISLPVALVSTTNMLSYNAPNIKSFKQDTALPPKKDAMLPPPKKDAKLLTKKDAISPTVASLIQSSGEDSDNSISGRSRASSQSSRHTSTDASSIASSPTSPAPNHLSGFFPPSKQVKKSASTTSLGQLREVKEETTEPVPAIPQRDVSHSKKAHEKLARKRSLQHVGTHSKSTSRSSLTQQRRSREQRSSLDIFKGTVTKDVHPFDKELKQLNEVAEEFIGVARDAEAETDLSIMRTMNLASFCASDYLAEIRPLFSDRFGIPHKAVPLAWI